MSDYGIAIFMDGSKALGEVTVRLTTIDTCRISKVLCPLRSHKTILVGVTTGHCMIGRMGYPEMTYVEAV